MGFLEGGRMSDQAVEAMLKCSSLDEAQKAWKEADNQPSEQVYEHLCEKVDANDDQAACKWLPNSPDADADDDRLLEQACVAGDQKVVEFLMEIGGKEILMKSVCGNGHSESIPIRWV